MRKKTTATLVAAAAATVGLAAASFAADSSGGDLTDWKTQVLAALAGSAVTVLAALTMRIKSWLTPSPPNPVEAILRDQNAVLLEENRSLSQRLAEAMVGESPLVVVLREELRKEEEARKRAEKRYRALLRVQEVDEREMISSTDPIDPKLLKEIRTGSFPPVKVDLDATGGDDES